MANCCLVPALMIRTPITDNASCWEYFNLDSHSID